MTVSDPPLPPNCSPRLASWASRERRSSAVSHVPLPNTWRRQEHEAPRSAWAPWGSPGTPLRLALVGRTPLYSPSCACRKSAAAHPLAPSDGSRTLRHVLPSTSRSCPTTSSSAPSVSVFTRAAVPLGSLRTLRPSSPVPRTTTRSAGTGAAWAAAALQAGERRWPRRRPSPARSVGPCRGRRRGSSPSCRSLAWGTSRPSWSACPCSRRRPA